MLMPIQIKEKELTRGDQDVEDITFADLRLVETDVEEFLRKNIDVIFEEMETLLVVGQQVINTGGGRTDLVALDAAGSIVLIELKRDQKDIKARKEPLESQAIRYAASLAKIRTPDELVDKIFENYIEKHKKEFDLGVLTAQEMGRRKLAEYLEENRAEKTFNQKQRIILIASSFDDQTLSAVAWLIQNGLDIAVFQLTPKRVGSALFLDIQRILPPDRLDDFYQDVISRSSAPPRQSISGTRGRTSLPRMRTLMDWGILKHGDTLVIKGNEDQDSEAEVIDHRFVRFKNEEITYNDWGKKVTGWSSICIYEWAMVKGDTKTLAERRQEKINDDLGKASDDQQRDGDDTPEQPV